MSKKQGKKYRQVAELVERAKRYTITEAVSILKKVSYSKFDGTVELSIRLGVDPKKPEEMVRGAVVLPYGLGKKRTVLVFAKGEKEIEAREGGADFVGGDDLIKRIQDGWLEFDVAIATPDMMGVVGKIGKILGPRGLMPNPKSGTVTFDVLKAIKEAKAGKVEFRIDKGGNLHLPVGKVSFAEENLIKNIITVLNSVVKAKPSSSKGTYLRNVVLSSTMSPGIKIDLSDIREKLKEMRE